MSHISEDTSLIAEQHGKSYESIPNFNGNSIIYCAHGKVPKTCCEKLEISTDSSRKRRHTLSWSHCHTKTGEVGVDKHARKRLIFASVLCVLFMIAEVIGGFLSNSLAIATDAAHLLTDLVSFMISLFSLWMAARPASRKMSFGWYRAEVIGALVSILLIWLVTGILVYMAVLRIVYKDFEIDGGIMLITAGAGVGVNLLMGVALQIGGVPHGHSHGGGSSHSHSHGDSEANDHTSAHKGKGNINVRAAFIHVLGDFFQSLGVLVAALVVYFKPDWTIVDPICTFLFSIIVLITTFTIIKDALNVLMEGMPRGIDFLEVQDTLCNIHGVVKVHNLRIWSLSLDKTALAAHLAIDPKVSPTSVLKQASEAIRAKFNVFELTLQVEEYQDEMSECAKCQDPIP